MKRAAFINFIPELDPQKIIVIDESGFALNMHVPYARGMKGKRVKMPAPMHGENISVIGAISLKGVMEIGMMRGSMNQSCVEAFIGDILLPKITKGDVLVIDNAPIHNIENIKKILHRVGAKVLPLPPYSPDLSPIEMLWSKLKQIVVGFSPRSIGALYEALKDSLPFIDSDDIEGWFEHCGYNLV